MGRCLRIRADALPRPPLASVGRCSRSMTSPGRCGGWAPHSCSGLRGTSPRHRSQMPVRPTMPSRKRRDATGFRRRGPCFSGSTRKLGSSASALCRRTSRPGRVSSFRRPRSRWCSWVAGFAGSFPWLAFGVVHSPMAAQARACSRVQRRHGGPAGDSDDSRRPSQGNCVTRR